MTAHRAIVIIDDHPEHLDYLAMLLRRAGYGVAAFDKAQAALDHVAHAPVDLVITDVFMPDIDGIEVLMSLRRSFPDLPVSFFVARGEPSEVFESTESRSMRLRTR